MYRLWLARKIHRQKDIREYRQLLYVRVLFLSQLGFAILVSEDGQAYEAFTGFPKETMNSSTSPMQGYERRLTGRRGLRSPSSSSLHGGELLGPEIGKIEILVKGGYQNKSPLHGGGDAGIDGYLRF